MILRRRRTLSLIAATIVLITCLFATVGAQPSRKNNRIFINRVPCLTQAIGEPYSIKPLAGTKYVNQATT